MIWTINVIFCLLLTSVTGSIVFAFWCLLGKWLEKIGFLNISYILIKLDMLFFVIPLQYITMFWLDQSYAILRGDLFLHTMTIMTVCGIVFILWVMGVCCIWYKQFRIMRQTERLFRNSFSCGSHTEELFEKIEQELEIKKGKVALVQCYEAPTAMLWGIRQPTVVLPVEKYSDEELRVIFIHELMHYKHHDILWRRLASVLIGVHFFNPVIWKLQVLLRRWSEHSCDFSVYEKAGGIRHYFNTIIKIQMRSESLTSYFAATLSENEDELTERIMKMKVQKKIKKRSAWKAAAIAVIMLLGSSMTVIASSKGMADMYHMAYDTTDVAVEEGLDPELEEYEESGETEGIIEETGEINEVMRSTKTFNWSVASGVRKTSLGFSAKSGGSILLSAAISPTNKTVRIGIVEPNGNRRYVSGNGYLSKSFSLTKTGTYKVYVENNSGTKVSAEGSYIVK